MSYGEKLQPGDRIQTILGWSEVVRLPDGDICIVGPCNWEYDHDWVKKIAGAEKGTDVCCSTCGYTYGGCIHAQEAICIAQQLIAEKLI